MHNPSQRHPLSHHAFAALALGGALFACAASDPNDAAAADPTEPAAPSETVSTPDTTPPAPTATAAADSAPAAAADMASSAVDTALFHAAEPWTQPVAALPKSASSDSIIGWLGDHGGWGTHTLRIEFSLKVLHARGEVPFRSFTPTEDFYTPDCDNVPFPVPPDGALEDEDGYTCTTDGDCHLLVVHEPSQKLYEMWRANIQGDDFKGGCVAVWDLNRSYPNGRGDNCTSADAGGFPVSAMVFTADEVAKGSIDHALRFILPNSRIRRGVYVAPASHASDSLHGEADAPPYGVRFRLRADYPLETLPSDGARVVAKAMQQYGMLLADGGRVPLTAADDRNSEHKWTEVGVGSESLAAIAVSDMEVVDLGEPVKATGDCERK
jgi:hypothetical protein